MKWLATRNPKLLVIGSNQIWRLFWHTFSFILNSALFSFFVFLFISSFFPYIFPVLFVLQLYSFQVYYIVIGSNQIWRHFWHTFSFILNSALFSFFVFLFINSFFPYIFPALFVLQLYSFKVYSKYAMQTDTK